MQNREDELRNKIVDEARKFIGVKWRHQGRSVHGIDCVGLIARIAKQLDLISDEMDKTNYSRSPTNHYLMTCFREAGFINKNYNDRKVGDVLLFKQKTLPCHTGILSFKNGKFHLIHAFLARRKVVEEPMNSMWENNVVHCLQYPRII